MILACLQATCHGTGFTADGLQAKLDPHSKDDQVGGVGDKWIIMPCSDSATVFLSFMPQKALCTPYPYPTDLIFPILQL